GYRPPEGHEGSALSGPPPRTPRPGAPRPRPARADNERRVRRARGARCFMGGGWPSVARRDGEGILSPPAGGAARGPRGGGTSPRRRTCGAVPRGNRGAHRAARRRDRAWWARPLYWLGGRARPHYGDAPPAGRDPADRAASSRARRSPRDTGADGHVLFVSARPRASHRVG